MEGNENMLADPARNDLLICVDGLDRQTGTASKLEAHTKDLLHRAFSVVLFRQGEAGTEVLLARRSMSKYHSGGLWANSCCSHPRAGEELLDAAQRRTHEELGCAVEGLREIGSFVYHAAFENGVYEHEYDHVLLGAFAGELDLCSNEVSEARWVTLDALAAELAEKPERFAVWAPIALSMALKELAPSA